MSKGYADNAVDALFRLTEWNLATLEELKDLKSTSKRRLERQQRICEAAVGDCVRFGNISGKAVAERMGCIRLLAILNGGKS